MLQDHHVAAQRKTRVMTTGQPPLTIPDTIWLGLLDEAYKKGMQCLPVANSDFVREKLKFTVLLFVLNLHKDAVATYCELSAHEGLANRIEMLKTANIGPTMTSTAQKKYGWQAEEARPKQAAAAAHQPKAQHTVQQQKQQQQQQRQQKPTCPDGPAQQRALQDQRQRQVEGWQQQQQ